jgi:predicted Zn-dependent protease
LYRKFPRVVRFLGRLAVVGLPLAALGAYLLWLYHFRAAEGALKEFRLDRARDHLAQCLKVWPYGSETQFLAAQTARRLDALDEAEQRLSEYERDRGPSPAAALERALLRAQRGDVDDVKARLYALVEKDDPQADLALEALARGHLLNFRTDLALKALDMLLERHPDHLPALVLRASIYEELRRTEDAANDYGRAVERDPEAFEPRLRLAGLLSTLGRAREAIYHYEWLRQLRPGDARVVVGLARGRVDQQERAEARRLLDELLASQPDDVPALVERGRLDVRAGKPQEAAPLLRRATRLGPHDRDAFWVLHLCLEMLGEEDEDRLCLAGVTRIDGERQRLEDLLSQVREDPYNPSLRCELGVFLIRIDRGEEGARILSEVVALDPRHERARRALDEYSQRKPH